MLLLTSLALVALAMFALLRLPRPLVRVYLGSFAARHGVGVQIGLTVLASLTVSMLLAALLNPGKSPLTELVAAAVVGCGLIAGSADFYLFLRGRRKLRQDRSHN